MVDSTDTISELQNDFLRCELTSPKERCHNLIEERDSQTSSSNSLKGFVTQFNFVDFSAVVILATLSHSQSESRISNTWSLSTNQKAGFNYPRKVASYQGVRHVRHHEKSPNIPPSCNSTPNVTFQLILFWRHSLFYKRDVCDLLVTSRPFKYSFIVQVWKN